MNKSLNVAARLSGRTATSRTSFWLLFVHCSAFRIGGSLAVSNLTEKLVSDHVELG